MEILLHKALRYFLELVAAILDTSPSGGKGLLSGAAHFIWSEKEDYNSPSKLILEEAALNSQQAETVNFLKMKNSSEVPIMLRHIYKE